MNGGFKYILIPAGVLFSVFLCPAQERSLDYYIQAGFANSPVLKDISNRVNQNSTDSLISKAGFKPQVSFSGYMMYAPVINGYGYSDVITNGQNLSGTMNVSQDFFNKKTREAQFEKFGIMNKSLVNEGKITRNELQKEITGQYLNACSVFLEIGFNNEMLSTLDQEQEILGKLVEAGLYRQTDYLSFRIEIASLKRRIKDLQLQFRKEMSSLNILCGIPDTAFYTLKLPELSVIESQSKGGAPFFRRFQLDSLKIENEKTIIDRKYKPDFSWFSDAGLVNNEPRYIYQNFGLSLGLSLTLPVYDGNQRKLNFSKLKAAEDTRRNYEDYFRLQVDMQLMQLKDDLERTRSVIRDTQEQIRLSSTLCEQDKVLLNSGSIPVTDYVIALRNLLEARQVLVHYQVHALQIINELNFWKQ